MTDLVFFQDKIYFIVLTLGQQHLFPKLVLTFEENICFVLKICSYSTYQNASVNYSVFHRFRQS
jgi:hypothetical protein